MIGWAWRASKSLDLSAVLRVKFVLAAIRERKTSRKLQNPTAHELRYLISDSPQIVGHLIWPYQCSAWNVEKRFSRIDSHFKFIENSPQLKFGIDDKLVLMDLSFLSADLSLILDRPGWLSREGSLTLSLFKGRFRAFTVSFSLSRHRTTELFIGGIQGRKTEDILSLYRDLTKQLCGMRPRDFLIESLRLFAVTLNVDHIYAVADEFKIARHKYFGDLNTQGLFYDDIWLERGARIIADTHYELPLIQERREIELVAPKKRAMYRRRYQMLDQIKDGLALGIARAERRRFEAT